MNIKSTLCLNIWIYLVSKPPSLFSCPVSAPFLGYPSINSFLGGLPQSCLWAVFTIAVTQCNLLYCSTTFVLKGSNLGVFGLWFICCFLLYDLKNCIGSSRMFRSWDTKFPTVFLKILTIWPSKLSSLDTLMTFVHHKFRINLQFREMCNIRCSWQLWIKCKTKTHTQNREILSKYAFLLYQRQFLRRKILDLKKAFPHLCTAH